MDAGLIPVKELRRAKSRLGPAFGDAERLEIARALLDDALLLAASVGFLEWWVVTDDDEVAGKATERGIRVAPEPGDGLNAALSAGIAAAAGAGAESVTILPCDIPLAFRGDLEDLRDTGATSDVVLVPSGDDGGTNGLFLSPPDVLEPRFGEESMKRHLEVAESLGVRCSILALARLALDIDTVDDVDAFLEWPNRFPSRTGEALERLRKAP